MTHTLAPLTTRCLLCAALTSAPPMVRAADPAAADPSTIAETSDPGDPETPAARLTALRDALHRSGTSQAYVAVGDRVLIGERARGAPRLVSVQSITKSVVSLAVGALIGEGRITSIDDPVARYLPDFTGGPRARVTLRHVLTHRSGIAAGDDFGLAVEAADDALAFAMTAPFDAEPGAKFAYNNAAIQLVRGVVESAAGMPLERYVARTLFEPLGIRRYRWGKDARGGALAHAALELSAPDLAKIGRLVAGRGQWNGRQVIAEAWFDLATPTTASGALADTAFGIWWNIRQDEVRSRVEIDSAAIAAYEQAGLDPDLLAKLRSLPTAGALGDVLEGYATTLTPEEQAAIRDLRLAHSLPAFLRADVVAAGYYSTGGGGQYLVFDVRTGLVAVRLLDPSTADGEATSHTSFPWDALSLGQAWDDTSRP